MRGTGVRPEGRDEWIERVRAASDIAEVIGEHVALRRAGRNWTGLCPFHKEKTPSFSVNVERQFFHCFGCKVGGDVFRFVQEHEKLGFVEAAELLSRRAGIPIPERRGGADRGVRARLLETLEAAAVAYEQWLADPELGASARAMLERRGITRDARRRFRLGLAPAGWDHLARRLAGAGEDALLGAGLVARREGGRGVYDRFRNRLMVPLIAPGGAVVGFGARALADDEPPKYLNSPETVVYHKGSFLFALEQARRNVEPDGELVVVEGYFDAIAFHQAGIGHTVATSGTALTPEQARLLRRLAPRVVLTYDGDAAGQDAMRRSLGVLLAEGLEVRVADLPEGEDPDTLVRRGGPAAWEPVRARACDPVEFVQRHVLRGHGAGDPRERALLAVVELAAEVREPVRRALLLERAEQVLGFPGEVLRRAAALRAAGAAKREGAAAEREGAAAERAAATAGGPARPAPWAERRLLQLVLQHPDAIAPLFERVGPEDFEDPAMAGIADWLAAGAPGGAPADETQAVRVRELLAEGLELADWAGEVDNLADRLVEHRLRRAARACQREIEKARDQAELAALLERKTEIAKSLGELRARAAARLKPAPHATA